MTKKKRHWGVFTEHMKNLTVVSYVGGRGTAVQGALVSELRLEYVVLRGFK